MKRFCGLNLINDLISVGISVERPSFNKNAQANKKGKQITQI